MKVHFSERPVLVGQPPEVNLSTLPDGVVLHVDAPGQGQIVRVTLTPEEARSFGIGAIGIAAVWEVERAKQQEAAKNVIRMKPNGVT